MYDVRTLCVVAILCAFRLSSKRTPNRWNICDKWQFFLRFFPFLHVPYTTHDSLFFSFSFSSSVDMPPQFFAMSQRPDQNRLTMISIRRIHMCIHKCIGRDATAKIILKRFERVEHESGWWHTYSTETDEWRVCFSSFFFFLLLHIPNTHTVYTWRTRVNKFTKRVPHVPLCIRWNHLTSPKPKQKQRKKKETKRTVRLLFGDMARVKDTRKCQMCVCVRTKIDEIYLLCELCKQLPEWKRWVLCVFGFHCARLTFMTFHALALCSIYILPFSVSIVSVCQVKHTLARGLHPYFGSSVPSQELAHRRSCWWFLFGVYKTSTIWWTRNCFSFAPFSFTIYTQQQYYVFIL